MTRWTPPRRVVAERNLRSTRRAIWISMSIVVAGIIVAGAAAFGAPVSSGVSSAASFVAILGFVAFVIAKTTSAIRSPQWYIEVLEDE